MGHDEVEVRPLMFKRFFARFSHLDKRVEPIKSTSHDAAPFDSVPAESSYDTLRRQGTELLNRGELLNAAAIFELAFKKKPCAESHLNLGFALWELQRPEEAKIHLDQAAVLGPDVFDAQLLCAMLAVANGDHDTALATIQAALEIEPDSVVAINILYKLFATRDAFEKIEAHVVTAAKANLTPAGRHVAVAIAFMGIPASGELKEGLLKVASERLHSATTLDPHDPLAFATLGKLFLAQNEVALAIESFTNAIIVDSSFAPAQYGLAIAFKIQGDKVQSAIHSKNAITADLRYVDAYKLLAEISTENSDYPEAISQYRKILAIEPDSPDILLMLGCVYAEMDEIQLAIDTTRQAVKLRKDSAEVYFALGNILCVKNLYSEAVDCYQHALKLRPDYFDVRNNLASAMLGMGKNEEALSMYKAIVRDDPTHLTGLQNIAFSQSFDPACSPQEYLLTARQYGAVVTSKSKPYASWTQQPLAGRPLKVGLVSGDLRMHPVGFFLESVLTYFDIEKIEIYAYSNRTTTDDLQASLKSRVTSWTSIVGLSDEVTAKLIHEAELDLLIDLSGHTGMGRCSVFAWRPAPVQAAWLGYWASTGVAEIDYVLVDRHSVLPDQHCHFSERVWYLTDTRLCFTPPSALYEVLPGPCPAVKSGHITFGCFQSIRKLNTDVLVLWGRIHKRMPTARFRLQGGGFNDPKIRDELLARLSDAGIPSHLVAIYNSTPGVEYLKSYAEVDIVLDTFPYPGGTTTCDALWMGTPTVTLAGKTLLSRQGVSLLSYAKLEDWIAKTKNEYVDIAVQKAGDVAQLTRLRSGLRLQVFNSPLFNAPGFASSLEDTLRSMVIDKIPHLDGAA